MWGLVIDLYVKVLVASVEIALMIITESIKLAVHIVSESVSVALEIGQHPSGAATILTGGSLTTGQLLGHPAAVFLNENAGTIVLVPLRVVHPEVHQMALNLHWPAGACVLTAIAAGCGQLFVVSTAV